MDKTLSEANLQGWTTIVDLSSTSNRAEEIYQQEKEALSSISNRDSWVIDVFGYGGLNVVELRKSISAKLELGEIVFCCIVGFMRGNNIERIIESTNSSEAKSKMKAIKNKINLKSRAAGKTTHPTLSRVSLCFPKIVAAILSTIPDIPSAVAYDSIKSESGVPDYPSLSRASGLACMLPRNAEHTELIMNVFFLPNMMLSEVINQRKEEWVKSEKSTRASSSKIYLLNALNSQMFSEKERLDWCVKLGIISDPKRGGVYSSNWYTAAREAKRVLDRDYGVSF